MHSMAPITHSLTMGDVVQRVKMSKIVTLEICPVHLCTVHCHGLPSNLDLVFFLFSIDFTIKLINQQSPFCNFGHKFYRPLITWLLRLLLWYLLNQHLPSHLRIDKPKVVWQSQSQKLTTRFSLKLQFPTTPTQICLN